ncbi:MAG TPA: SGNH/GDSL hydrolase family protein [Marmoricola sp.]|nr:SGNH/GDSL hydrolase family protein [Marmoricola sp.]
MDRRADLTQVPISIDLLRGALELEQTDRGALPHRLPLHARRYADGQLAMVEEQPSGVRLAFRSRATYLRLETIPTKQVYVGGPSRPDGVYDLLLDGRLTGQATASGGDTLAVDLATGAVQASSGPVAAVEFADLPDRDKVVEIWLPWNERTLLVGLWADAPVDVLPDHDRPRWVHHGSSISHGSDASSPTSTWPAVAAAFAGVDLVNLGFGGGALLDPLVARAVRDTTADLISLKIGINLVNTDLMRLRGFAPAVHGFLDTIRDGHPETPLLVIGPIACPIHESTPGPSEMDLADAQEGRLRLHATGDPAEVSAGKLTLQVIRQELARIVALRAPDDPHLGYLDGLELYGVPDTATHPLPDNLHPDAATQRLIGERFAERAFGRGAFFGPQAGVPARAT